MQMPNRTAKLVIFAGFLAAISIATLSHTAARAADDCLSGPRNHAPQGGHWYYRIDHVTKRHCWYLGDEREKLSQNAPTNLSPSPEPIAPKAETAMQPSIADAHAEFTAQSPVERPNGSDARMRADAPVRDSNAVTGTAGAEAKQSTVASRWPDGADADPSTSPAPGKADPGVNEGATPKAQPPTILATAKFAAADLSSPISAGSVPMLLAAIMVALALAGIMAAAIFKFGSLQHARAQQVRERRTAIWESADANLGRRAGSSRGFGQAGGRNHRIAEFFAQISERAPS
jgi:hypothetical protein